MTLEPRGLTSDNFRNLTKPNLTSEPTSRSTEVRKQAAFKLSSAALFILCADTFITSHVVQISAARKSYSRRDCAKIWTVMSVLITDVSRPSFYDCFSPRLEWGRPVFRCSCTTFCMTFSNKSPICMKSWCLSFMPNSLNTNALGSQVRSAGRNVWRVRRGQLLFKVPVCWN